MICYILIFSNIFYSPLSTTSDSSTSEPDTVYHSFEAKQWEKLPVHTLRDIIMLQPGVVDCRGDLHIRGGFAENIEYWIDGVPLYIPNLPVGFINKISFNSNPTSGRYGRSNVVEIEIKERVKSGGWLTGSDEGMSTYELSASGKYNDKLKYSFMGYTKSRDYERSYLFDLSNTDSDLYYLLGSMKYEVSPNINIGLGFIAVRGQGGLYTTFLALPRSGGDRSDNSEKYNTDWLRSSWLEKGRQFYAFLQHRINENIYYSVRYVNFTQHEIIGEKDLDFEKERRFYEDIEFEPWWFYTYDPPHSAWHERDESGEYIYPDGVPYIFRFGSPGLWHNMERNLNLLNVDFNTKIADWIRLEGGFESKIITINKEMADYIYYLPVTDSVTTSGDTIIVVISEYRNIENNLSWEKYVKKPILGDLWVDLTAYKSKVIFKTGIRVDFYNPRIWKYRDPLKPRNPDGTYDTIPSELIWKINPMLHVSYFPKPKVEILLGYNRFHFIMPYSNNYYGNTNSDFDYFENITVNFSRFNYTTRQEVQPELSHVGMFQAQLIYSIKDNFIASLSYFRKEIYGLPRMYLFAAIPEPYWAYKYDGDCTTNGIEILLQYNSLENLLFDLGYTFQDSKWSFFTQKKVYYPSPWDKRHTITVLVSKDIKDGWTIRKFMPFDNVNISLLFRTNSGSPYTNTDEFGHILGDINTERNKWFHITDIKLTKGIKVAGFDLSLFIEIDNLFNTENILNVYSNTGKPDDNGLMIDREYYLDCTFPSSYEDEGKVPVGVLIDGSADERRDFDGDGYITMNEWYESYVRAYTDYMRNPFNYGPPRKISVGMQIVW